MFESFGPRCFGLVASCTVVVVDNGGQGDVRHIQIGGAVTEVNGIFDALVCPHDF